MPAGDRYPAAADPIRQFAEDLAEMRRRISELEGRNSDTGRGSGIAIGGTPSAGDVLTATGTGIADWLPVSQVTGNAAVYSASVSGVVTINLGHGSTLVLTLVGDITSLIVSGALMGARSAFEVHFVQDGAGGRSIAFPPAWKFTFGISPVVSPGPGARDRFSCVTLDGGATIFADMVGRAYA